MIKNEDLEKFRGQYPYGSELFGIYQTLIGWRGARARTWFLTGYARDRKALRDSIVRNMIGDADAVPNADGVLDKIGRINIGRANDQPKYGSMLVRVLAPHLEGGNPDDPAFWKGKLTDDLLAAALNRDVRDEALAMMKRNDNDPAGAMLLKQNPIQARSQRTLNFINTESAVAGQLKALRDNGAASELKQMFFLHSTAADRIKQAAAALNNVSPFWQLDPLDSRSSISG